MFGDLGERGSTQRHDGTQLTSVVGNRSLGPDPVGNFPVHNHRTPMVGNRVRMKAHMHSPAG